MELGFYHAATAAAKAVIACLHLLSALRTVPFNAQTGPRIRGPSHGPRGRPGKGLGTESQQLQFFRNFSIKS